MGDKTNDRTIFKHPVYSYSFSTLHLALEPKITSMAAISVGFGFSSRSCTLSNPIRSHFQSLTAKLLSLLASVKIIFLNKS